MRQSSPYQSIDQHTLKQNSCGQRELKKYIPLIQDDSVDRNQKQKANKYRIPKVKIKNIFPKQSEKVSTLKIK